MLFVLSRKSVRLGSLALVGALTAVAFAFAVSDADAKKKVKRIKPKDGAYVTKISTKKPWAYFGTYKGKITIVGMNLKFPGCKPNLDLYSDEGLYQVVSVLKKQKKPNKKNKFSFRLTQHDFSTIDVKVKGKFLTKNKAEFTVQGTAGGCKVKKRTFKNAKWRGGG